MDRQKKQHSTHQSVSTTQGNSVQTMKKYEYQVLKINVQSSQEDVETFYGEFLNAEGEKGWQLVQIIVKEFGMYIQHSYYFIREKQK